MELDAYQQQELEEIANLNKNIDIFAISKRLGHADLNTTTRVYAYLIDELKQRSDQDIENVLNDLSYENNTTQYKANVE